jgi:hypothetical protein
MQPLPNAVTYPSAALPAPWGFEFSCPDGWVAEAVPGALCAVHAPALIDGFQPNLVISSARVADTIDLRTLALRALTAAGRRGTDPQFEMQRLGTFHGRPTYLQVITLGRHPRASRGPTFGFFFGPARAGPRYRPLRRGRRTCLSRFAEARTWRPVPGHHRVAALRATRPRGHRSLEHRRRGR